MTTVFPGSIDSYSAKTDDVDDVLASHVNDLQEAIVAIETALGSQDTFTPTIYGTTTNGIGTYTTQVGVYQQIMNIIFFSISLVWTAHTGTGYMRIGGLPAASVNNNAPSSLSIYVSGVPAPVITQNLMCTVIPGSDKIMISAITSEGTVDAILLDTAGEIGVTGFYFI